MTATEAPPNGRANTTLVGPPRRLASSATRIQLGNKKIAKAQAGKRQEWQAEAYEYFDDIGIVKFGIRFRGNQMAKLRLYPAVRPLDDPDGAPIPLTDPDSGISADVARRANAEIERVKGASGGTPEMLRLLDMNVEIGGECFIIGIGPRVKIERDAEGNEVEVLILESWDVRSILEVEIGGEGEVKVKTDAGTVKLDPMLDTCVRVWQRHPAWAGRADCNMRAVLGDCESLVLLTNEVKAESKSNQSNGILFIPNTMSVTTPSRTSPADEGADPDAIDAYPDDATDAGAASIGDALEDAIMEPISDPSSAWSVWPLILVGPAEDGDKIRHIQMHRDASEVLEERIRERKEAIAQGLNLPIETLKGHQQTTFANAEVIDADIYSKHLEPSAVLLCDMWTIGLLRPALIDAGIAPEIAERIIVWFDPAALLESADPNEKVAEAHALGLIGGEAARRYWGYSEDDAPDPVERLIDAILRNTQWDAGLVDAVVRMLDPSLDFPEPAAPAGLFASLGALRQNPHDPAARSEVLAGLFALQQSKPLRAAAKTTPAKAGERLAAIDRDLQTKTLAVANSAMTRALERAGNRLKAKAGPTRETLRAVAPIYAAQQMGPGLVASAGIADADLIDTDAFEPTISQYHTWAKHAQASALAIAAALAGLTAAQRKQLAALQAQHLDDSTQWMRGQLHALADERLYQPDEREPAQGEFDPFARVPAGLVRMGIAIAGGATALEFTASNARDKYVALANDRPPGGIGTGELLTNAIVDSGAVVIEGYQWDYGAAFRQRPYEPHEELDGQVAESPVDFISDDATFGDYLFPGDHDGCQCLPLIPVYAERADVTGGSAGTGLDAPGADLFGEGD